MSDDQTFSQRLAEFVTQLDGAEIPRSVRRTAVLHALDTIGCGLAGYGMGEGQAATAAVTETSTGGPCTAIGVDGGLQAHDAAFVNGVLCHVLDFDDTHPDSVVHVNATITPAALALGQQLGATGPDVVTALVLGNEVSIRIGAVAPGRFHARGFHPTGVAGVFGATAVAARLRRLDAAATAHALGIAASMSSGLLEFLADGAQTKPIHAGWAAQAGLSAARLAAHGATGPSTAFEGSRGFFASYLHGEPVDLVSPADDLGIRWVTSEIAYKSYPSCHYTHAPMDSLGELMRRHALHPDDIERIVAFTNATGVGLTLEPVADKLRPRTPYDSKFSLPFCLGSLLVHGTVDVGSFGGERINESAVLAIASRVGYEQRDYNPGGDSFGGGVRVTLRNGRVLEHESPCPRGGADNPMTDDEVVAKFRANAGQALAETEIDALQQLLVGLDDAIDDDALAGLSVLARVAGVPAPV